MTKITNSKVGAGLFEHNLSIKCENFGPSHMV